MLATWLCSVRGVDERLARIDTAGQLEGDDGAGSLGRQLLSAFEPWRGGESRVGNGGDLDVTVEEFGDLLCIGYVALDAQAQGFDTLRDEERVERRHGGTEIAQQLDAGLELRTPARRGPRR